MIIDYFLSSSCAKHVETLIFFFFYSDLVLTVSRQSLRSQRGNKIVFGTWEAAAPGIWTTATRMEMVLQMVPNRTWKHNLIRYLVVFNLTT